MPRFAGCRARAERSSSASASVFQARCEGGILDREKLAQTVLDDPTRLAELEAMVHPEVQRARELFLQNHRDAPAPLFEIPLLFETGGEGAFDTIIVVSAPADVQRKRVLERAGMTAEKFAAISARQVPDADKRARADFVIDTGGDLSTTEAPGRGNSGLPRTRRRVDRFRCAGNRLRY